MNLHITVEQKAALLKQLVYAPCVHCGGVHERACPRVKRIDKLGNGNVTAVEYVRTFDETGILWPEEAYDPEDTDG